VKLLELDGRSNLIVIDIASRDIDHAFRPLVQVARALRGLAH